MLWLGNPPFYSSYERNALQCWDPSGPIPPKSDIFCAWPHQPVLVPVPVFTPSHLTFTTQSHFNPLSSSPQSQALLWPAPLFSAFQPGWFPHLLVECQQGKYWEHKRLYPFSQVLFLAPKHSQAAKKSNCRESPSVPGWSMLGADRIFGVFSCQSLCWAWTNCNFWNLITWVNLDNLTGIPKDILLTLGQHLWQIWSSCSKAQRN